MDLFTWLALVLAIITGLVLGAFALFLVVGTLARIFRGNEDDEPTEEQISFREKMKKAMEKE